MRKERISAPAVGGSSLLVIFAVLCLTVFALLSLSTVQAEKRMADAAAEAVADYYAADLQAQEVFARLRTGETVGGVLVDGNRYHYSCSISKHQVLEVTLDIAYKYMENTMTLSAKGVENISTPAAEQITSVVMNRQSAISLRNLLIQTLGDE